MVLNVSHISVFARAILALNRVGNELYMEPSNFGVSLLKISEKQGFRVSRILVSGECN